MFVIFPQGGSFGMAPVTSVQCAPPSLVTCTSPSFEPAQITPTPLCAGDSASANSVAPSNVMRLSVVTPPELCWCVVSLRVRSGLTTCQLAPPSVVTCTTWLPTYTFVWSWGEMAIGNVQFQRYLRSAGRPPYPPPGPPPPLRAGAGWPPSPSTPPPGTHATTPPC